ALKQAGTPDRWMEILKSANGVGDGFKLQKSGMKLNDLISKGIEAAKELEALQSQYDLEAIRKRVSEIQDTISDVGDVQALVKALNQLAGQLKDSRPYDYRTLAGQIESIRRADILGPKDDLEELRGALPAKYPLQKALLPLFLGEISKSGGMAAYADLEAFLSQLEAGAPSTLDEDRDEFRKAVIDFFGIEGGLPK